MDILYRGYGESSASIFSSENGFRARDTTTNGEDARTLSLHLQWWQRAASPLISTTTNRWKAETFANAARAWYDKRQPERKERIFVGTLDTSRGSPERPRTFHMRTLADRLGVTLESRASNYHEYLFEHFIPLEWVIEVQEMGNCVGHFPVYQGLMSISSDASEKWVPIYQMAADVYETLLSEPFLCRCPREKECVWMSIAYA
ncbi:hypothetical protein C8R47DRAFT_631728 [Mycena vitilis]|nr:hypothetical protein C8R47DRAFT_631728 [Mycena vitilis]